MNNLSEFLTSLEALIAAARTASAPPPRRLMTDAEFGEKVLGFMKRLQLPWTVTAKDFVNVLQPEMPKDRDWPNTPSKMASRLRGCIPLLAKRGLFCIAPTNATRTPGTRDRVWTFYGERPRVKFEYSDWSAQKDLATQLARLRLHISEVSGQIEKERGADGFNESSNANQQYLKALYEQYDRMQARVTQKKKGLLRVPMLAAAREDDPETSAAVKLGRRGGKARSRKLSSRRRSEIGRKAAMARWG